MGTIFISTYKDIELPQDDVLTPIQVGYAKDFGILRDNTGDNIAEKNRNYSELTLFYWIWKNYKDDYIGHYGYRRFLDIKIEDIPERLKFYDFIIGEPFIVPQDNIAQQFIDCHGKHNWNVLLKGLEDLGYSTTFFYNTRDLQYSNLFIATYDKFSKYMSWLWNIINKLESRVEIPKEDYQCFIFAFLAERLFTFYLSYYQMETRKVPVIFNPNL